jgi:tetratricopeptide (TPR) repeat protein
VAYAMLLDPKSARKDFEAVVEIGWPRHVALANLGQLAVEQGELGRGVQLLSESIAEYSLHAPAFTSRGFVFFELGEYRRALCDQNRALWLAKDDVVTLVDRAYTYEALGRLHDALADARRAREIDADRVRSLREKLELRVEQRLNGPDSTIRSD